MQFDGKSGLVTGGSRGIGRGCALELAKAGANVAINYHSNGAAADEVVAEIKKMGRDAIAIQADVSDQASVEQMVAKTVEAFGSLDLFGSNAAQSERQLMIEADMEGFRRTVDVSMWGAFYGLRASAQQMVKQGTGGAITIVSSPHANIAFPNAMAYNMSKAAIDQMARTAAIELIDDKIRVNIVHPGWIDTPGERKFYTEEQLATGASHLPLKRLGTSEEIGKAVLYTLSPDASYMTGSTLLIDGGISLPWWSRTKDGLEG
jgi:glucose 1-dehydrogenase